MAIPFETIEKLVAVEFYKKALKERSTNLSRSALLWASLVTEEQFKKIAADVRQNGLFSIYYEDEDIPHRDVVKMFYDTLHTWFVPSDKDCTFCIDSGEETLGRLRSNFKIPLEEIILFQRDTSFWSDNNQGLVITDDGIYCLPDNEDATSLFFVGWKDFDTVRYQELTLYFLSDGKEIVHMSKDMFFKGSDIPFKEKGTALAAALTQIAQLVETEIGVRELIDAKKYEEAIAKMEACIKANLDDADAHYYLGIALLFQERDSEGEPDSKNLERAIEEFNTVIDKEEVDDMTKALTFKHLGLCYSLSADHLKARNYYILAANCDDAGIKEEAISHLNKAEKSLKDVWDNYTTYFKYNERKFIMPIKDANIGGCLADEIKVFRMSNIPSCLTFPMSHPTANQLYIGHPYNPSMYIPYQEAEETFFVDKVHELCYLLECLGAEEIAITSIKGMNVNAMGDLSLHGDVNAEHKLFSGGVEANGKCSGQLDTSFNNQRSMTIKLDPMRPPYLPDGLIWYNDQPQWQRLVHSRLDGNMLEYSEMVSSSQTKFISATANADIKAAAKLLWTAAHYEVDGNLQIQFKEATETQWKIEVRFRSIKEFASTGSPVQIESTKAAESASAMNENEQQYTEEVRLCLADGKIGDRERRFLNRMCERLGISQERALEIELELQKNGTLTEEERTYMEEVKFCYEDDGMIDEKECKYLDRIREKFGITPERAQELEQLFLQSRLTDDEQEYVNAMKEEMVDGVIPDSARRLLNRLRTSMDITEERAKELEQYLHN